jgi:hypothetical protein
VRKLYRTWNKAPDIEQDGVVVKFYICIQETGSLLNYRLSWFFSRDVPESLQANAEITHTSIERLSHFECFLFNNNDHHHVPFEANNPCS